MKPSLLIAGAGYLGSEIARLAESEFTVHTLTKSGGDGSHACDLSDDAAVARIASLFPAPDLVIHCASSGRGGPDAYRGIFVQGCKSLLDHFPKSHLLFTSSTSVYHQTDGSEVTEDSATEPERETSQLLLEAEKIVLNGGGTVARLAGLYGPDRSVVWRKFLADEAVIEEDGRRILNQIHVLDAARACLFLSQRKAAGLFNVSDNTPLTQMETYQGLAEILGKELPPSGEKNTSRKRAWTHKKVLNSKLTSLGWEPRYPSFLDAARTFAS
ncbi:MAG: NAD-dependent epimerase/dehydratase family protein [Akkermansiaceae bacterium]|nr:NAD-dependent epimerase/dehydratase family protein [Akkermansiaceae bacterium]MDB4143736.1 NAD-dependent epimerase/dehydratase family protein [Akkermansiaceae bacterium]MDB4433946.1 NAD-dependent epimerase/dehydratase family protein [Akkermansiaceae bacterium]MDB4570480.1 NAD-dependent epimerase/dehydratase family protein [Akkermansiaceae bacterium]